MSDTIYEFSPEKQARPQSPRRKWLIALVAACPLVAAAVWGISVLERRRAETLVQERFELRTGFHNEVVAAIVQVPELGEGGHRYLAVYPRLQKIDLSGTTIVSGGLRPLLQVDDLRTLSLRDCAWVDDEQAAWLGELAGLKRLDLSGTRITDAALEVIRDLPRLSELKIQNCKGVTDAGLEICAGMDPLCELWLGGAGYSTDGLFALRDRRRDLNLQLRQSDNLGPMIPDSSWDNLLNTVWNVWEIHESSVEATLSTPADIEALSDLLRFKHNWGYGDASHPQGGYVEHIEEKWRSLELRGPAAVRSLATVFPLTPKLAALTLEGTTIATEEFPFDSVPPGLGWLHIERATISESFLRSLSKDAALQQLSLAHVAIDGVDLTDPALGQFTSLRSMELRDVTVDGMNLTDPALEQFTLRLSKQFPDTWINIYSTSSEKRIEWRNPYK